MKFLFEVIIISVIGAVIGFFSFMLLSFLVIFLYFPVLLFAFMMSLILLFATKYQKTGKLILFFILATFIGNYIAVVILTSLNPCFYGTIDCGLTGQHFEVIDYYCINNQTPVILLRNTGTDPLSVNTISIINNSDMTKKVNGIWTDYYDKVITEVAVGDSFKWTGGPDDICSSSIDDCTFRGVGESVRAQMARIQC